MYGLQKKQILNFWNFISGLFWRVETSEKQNGRRKGKQFQIYAACDVFVLILNL